MELRLYALMLWRSRWVIALTMISALMLALASAYLATPEYRSSTRFIVSPNPSLDREADNQILYGFDTLDRRSVITTYAAALSSRRIFTEAGAALGLAEADLLAYKATAVALPDANIIELAVTGPDAELARQLASSMGERMGAYSRQLYRDTYDFSVLDVATVPLAPLNPQPLRDASLALVLGAVLGAGLAILRGQMRRPLQSAQWRGQRDSASGAYTRASFERLLDRQIQRHPKDTLSLALIHFDGLREFIEAQPQQLARQLLQQITYTLRDELRGKDKIGRWDTARFVILMPGLKLSPADQVLERLRQAFAEPLQLHASGDAVRLSTAVGKALRINDEPAEQLLGQLEVALERACARETAAEGLSAAPEPLVSAKKSWR